MQKELIKTNKTANGWIYFFMNEIYVLAKIVGCENYTWDKRNLLWGKLTIFYI